MTAEIAKGVSGTVVAAWLLGDRDYAEMFVRSSEAIDELFGHSPPSSRVRGDECGYCTQDEESGSFLGCSNTIDDDSDDGILAFSTELEIIDGVVLVRDAGFADWND